MAVYCPNCGKRLPDDAVFCDDCGTKIHGEQAAESVREIRKTNPSPVRKGNTPAPKKSSGGFFRFLLILILAAGLLFGGFYLWITLHTNPGLDGNVYPGPNPGGQTDPGKDKDKDGGNSGTSQGTLKPSGNPAFEDFLFYENTVLVSGVPQNASALDAGLTDGSWKYCMIFNIHEEEGERFDEIGLAELSLGNGTASLILHPQLARYGLEAYKEDDASVGYEPFTGTWDNTSISLSGNQCTVTFWPYYEYNGKQYVLGSIVNGQGTLGHLVLVRP